MMDHDAKADLLRYLQEARDSLVWKVEGLGEYDVRRPLTPTGTNLLGLVKHLAGVELGYFGDTFGRPFFDKEPPTWWYTEDAELNADMWATPQESREQIVGLYRRAWEHSNATIASLTLDAVGRIPWWPAERSEVTLHHVVVRVLAETQRHAGHADIVRELVDGSVGDKRGGGNVPDGDQADWERYRDRLEQAAREAGDS
ncbi:DinB family protein [Streptomyces sp. NPDC005386]|uniref:DinB family protein n=1 Tax=Streptomyces sp. NPDC005386 TaxID=3154562 RepID=UPI0033A9E7FE